MASGTMGSNRSASAEQALLASESTLVAILKKTVEGLASLKLTVALLAMSIYLVLIGTFAQTHKDMWDVMADYFDSWFAFVRVSDNFPRPWFPKLQDLPGAYYIPGGKLIGCTMMVNLFAAHTVRFKMQARGLRLIQGLVVLAVGIVLTTLVIVSGHNRGGLQGKPPFSWSTMWMVIKVGLIGLTCAGVYGLFVVDRTRQSLRIMLWTGVAMLGLFLVAAFWPGTDSFLGDAGMRILWQLLQSTFAGAVLLVGCWLVFGKRGGVVLLHGGIGLLMVGQLFVSLFAVEERMRIHEGETVGYVQDIRGVELAFVDTSGEDKDNVCAISLTEKSKPSTYLTSGKIASDASGLPFDIEILQFFKNSTIRQATKDDENPATAGIGLTYVASEVRPGSGADTSGAVDIAAAYVKLNEKGSGRDLGTYLLSQILSTQNHVERFEAGGRTFEAMVRFKRSYKPYAVTLLDVRKDDYPGTNIPKNYSSDIRLVDPARKFDDQIHIRMNEPLRYAGETFYQSGYDTDENGTEVTDLQVVTNTGWMIPYVACMLVVVGMVAHFLQVLVRFLGRLVGKEEASGGKSGEPVTAEIVEPSRSRKGKKAARQLNANPGFADIVSRYGVAIGVILCCALLFGSLAKGPRPVSNELDLYRAGQLPVLEKGRVKPLDTLARNTLRMISNRETVKDLDGNTQPAIRWFLDVVSDRTEMRKVAEPKKGDGKAKAKAQAKANDEEEVLLAHMYPVFRIENDDVLNLLGLERRPGLRYSIKEMLPKIGDFQQKVEEARKRPEDALSTYERKLIELDGRIRTYTMVKAAFEPIAVPPMPTEAEFNRDPERAKRIIGAIRQALMQIPQQDQALERMQPPRATPMKRGDDSWLPYASAWNFDYARLAMGESKEPNEAVQGLAQVFSSYAAGDVTRFNKSVSEYQSLLGRMRPEFYEPTRVRFESWFNHVSPFFYSMWLYVLAFVLTAFAWLVWILGYHRSLNRAAFWLIVCTAVVHTAALIARIYMSGRPPVTNLYSSAIFIGWACVIFGIVIEAIFRLGIGNATSAVAGYLTLLIADKLAMDGDTMAVMQAVLDTQFWLSTHVVCISLGYSATYAAGLLGLVYVVLRLIPGGTKAIVGSWQGSPLTFGKALATMTYGVLCFAIFFSFWGTVLGGLWADDSWGRFWGWDPKENGALIIVLWNALVLHARWDRLAGERGLALLAIGGNIVTSWSWFGVNELGVGLHSYGFTEGVLFYLGTFAATQILAIIVGLLPTWKSETPGPSAPATA